VENQSGEADMNPLFGCIEAGGTKFVCGLMNSPDDTRAIATIVTTSPEETIRKVCSFFEVAQSAYGDITTHYSAAELGELIDAAEAIANRRMKETPNLMLISRKTEGSVGQVSEMKKGLTEKIC
jgi:hypothetical protein